VERKNICTNSAWEQVVGYSRAVKIGDRIHVSGTTATNEFGKIVGLGNPYTQTKQIIKNIESALILAGGSLKDVVRTRIYVTNIDRWRNVGQAYHEYFAEIRPATTMVEVSRLIAPEVLVEIEADAVISD
jgi:enamine deaminase RidA (YjgF/YER057c/UK114 family)